MVLNHSITYFTAQNDIFFWLKLLPIFFSKMNSQLSEAFAKSSDAIAIDDFISQTIGAFIDLPIIGRIIKCYLWSEEKEEVF